MLITQRCSDHLSNLRRLPAKTQTFSSLPSALLSLCSTTQLLRQVHARFILHGLHQNPTLSSDLIHRYGDLGRLDLSQRVFDSVRRPDAPLYNTVIRTLSTHGGESDRTLSLFRQMLRNSLYPDESTYPFVIDSCSGLSSRETGEEVHCHVIKLGFDSSFLVGTALAEMFGERRRVGSANNPFDSMSVRCLISWNLLISAARQCGDPAESFGLFQRMRLEGLGPDSATIVTLLRCCIDLRFPEAGKSVHVLSVVNDLAGGLSVSTALLTMYSRLGSLEMARLVFDKMHERDSVAWNAMISGYSRNGFPEQALELLTQMGRTGIRTDSFTAISSLSSAALLRSLKLGKQIHGHVIRNESDHQVSVHNSLIEMYSRCESLDSAQRVFDFVTNKTVVSWSSMIKGYVNHDSPSEALSLFDEMKMEGARPDSITVINVLPACAQLSVLERVESIHGYAIKQGLNSRTSVVTALLVTCAKCGCIEMARKLFDEEEVGQKDIVSWNSMIGAYSKHGNWSGCIELYSEMKASKLKPDQLTFLGLLTACVNSGRVNEGRECFNQMVEFYGYRPEQEHYACMVDLLGRSGHLGEAVKLIRSMPFEPDARVWGPLLSACKLHSETRLAEFAAERLIGMEPKNPGNYVLISNIYAAAGKWDGVAKMRGFLRGKGLKKTPGCSWLELNGRVHEFRVADRSHPESEGIYTLLTIVEQEFKADTDVSTEMSVSS